MQQRYVDPMPFFSRSTDADIDNALRLAGIGPSDRILDLGCGDGAVLLRAAHFGAKVIGVEYNRSLAAVARATLAESGISGDIVEGDMFAIAPTTFAPNVVFLFLTAASLQQLVPSLLSLPTGTRIVVVGTPVPGWLPTAEERGTFLYILPVVTHTPSTIGWGMPGLGVLVPSYRRWLLCCEVGHTAGLVNLRVSSSLSEVIRTRTGCNHLPCSAFVGVDLYFEPRSPGTVAEGAIESDGLGVLPVTVFYVDKGPFGAAPVALS